MIPETDFYIINTRHAIAKYLLLDVIHSKSPKKLALYEQKIAKPVPLPMC